MRYDILCRDIGTVARRKIGGIKNMADLEEIAGGVYAFVPSPSAARVGVVCTSPDGDNEAGERHSIYFIDSGGCAQDGKALLCAVHSVLGEVSVNAVILTHSHSDHAGGAAEIVRQTGCEVWTTAGERGGVENNRIQAAITCGGEAIPEIDVPYYVAQKCAVSRVISKDDVIPLGGGRKMAFVPLPGHYLDMTGVAADSKDGKKVFFVADALFGAQMVGKFPIPYMLDIGAFMDTLGLIDAFPADVFVPSHGDILSNVSETVEMNRLCILTTITAIEKALQQKPLTTDGVLEAVFDEEGLQLKSQQYFLVGSTIRSFLAYLYKGHRIAYRIEGNKLLWYKK